MLMDFPPHVRGHTRRRTPTISAIRQPVDHDGWGDVCCCSSSRFGRQIPVDATTRDRSRIFTFTKIASIAATGFYPLNLIKSFSIRRTIRLSNSTTANQPSLSFLSRIPKATSCLSQQPSQDVVSHSGYCFC